METIANFKNITNSTNPENLNELQNENQMKNTDNKTEILKLKKIQQNKDEPFKYLIKKNYFQKLIKKYRSGSLTSSIFNLCILSLGTGSLALPQKIGYMSLFFSPIIIILSGIVNYWSLNVLSKASIKFSINSYEGIVSKLFGKTLSIFLDLIMCINQFGMIILYQVILYKLLGGVVNEVFNYGYQGVEEFAEKSFWNDIIIKFIVCYLIMGFILSPLCLLKNISKMRYASMFGIFNLFFLIFIVVIESPFYIKHNFFDNKTKINFIDITVGFKKDMKILQTIATLFYAFSCHVGVFPVLNTLRDPSPKRINIIFKNSIILDISCYLIIGFFGYLTQPIDTPDLIIERKKLFKNDFLMIIGQICFIFTLIAKISANYNALRSCLINLFKLNKSHNQNQISNITNFTLTECSLIITTLIAVLFQSISSYISLIGGFCSIVISVLIPGLIYIKGLNQSNLNKNTIIAGSVIVILSFIGFTNGFLTIKKIIN